MVKVFTAAKMAMCCWLHPFIGVRIEFLETPENRLRHPRFAGIQSDKDARDILREEIGFLVPNRRVGR